MHEDYVQSLYQLVIVYYYYIVCMRVGMKERITRSNAFILFGKYKRVCTEESGVTTTTHTMEDTWIWINNIIWLILLLSINNNLQED